MSFEIVGELPPHRRADIERTLEVAVRELELERELVKLLVVRHRRELPKGVAAWAGPDGIWVREEVLTGNAFVTSLVLLEEAAHFKLVSLGGRRDGMTTFAGALIQEFFAAWFVWSQLDGVIEDRDKLFPEDPLPRQLATPKLGYALGHVAGAAAAGVRPAQQRLDEWISQGHPEPGTLKLVQRLERLASQSQTAPGLAAELARLFPHE